MAAGYCYCLGINSNAFFLNDYKKAFILGLNVPKVTAYQGRVLPGQREHEQLWCDAWLAFPEISVYPEQAGEMREG